MPQANPQANPQGLLTIWADITPEYQAEFCQWHNCEHVAERVSIPGFHVGRRYRALDENVTDFFMFYETDTAEVMRSDAYLHSQNNPTPWTRKSLSHFRNTLRTIYTLVAVCGEEPALDAPYLYVVRLNAPDRADGIEELCRWYRDEHLPRLQAVPGTLRARLYRAETNISNIVTAERRVHGASSGTQAFLALYELSAADVPTTAAWHDAARGTPWSTAMVAALRDVARESYWLDFTLWAPGRR